MSARLHAVKDAPDASRAADGASRKIATHENTQRRDARRARQARTRVDAGNMLHDALRLAGVSRQQFADWIGLSKNGVDLILCGEKSLAADDLQTPHPGVRRVAAIYLQLAAQRIAGEQAGAADVPVRERMTLAVETLGEALRTEREAMADGVLDAGEVRALDGLCTRAIDLVTETRDAIRLKAGGR